MKETKIPNTVDKLQSQLSNERKAYEAEIKRLKKALSESELRCLANSTMIDLAEKMFNIPIRKKRDAKKSILCLRARKRIRPRGVTSPFSAIILA